MFYSSVFSVLQTPIPSKMIYELINTHLLTNNKEFSVIYTSFVSCTLDHYHKKLKCFAVNMLFCLWQMRLKKVIKTHMRISAAYT